MVANSSVCAFTKRGARAASAERTRAVVNESVSMTTFGACNKSGAKAMTLTDRQGQELSDRNGERETCGQIEQLPVQAMHISGETWRVGAVLGGIR